MKRTIAIILALLMVSVLGVALVNAEDDTTPDTRVWSETESVDEKSGNYSYGTAYGYDFRIDKVNGVIGGEDSTIITNADAYNACNPNWAISVPLKKLEDNKYEVLEGTLEAPMRDSSWTPASANFDFSNGNIVMVVHSATSKKAEAEEKGYTNWQQKVVAIALKAGDVVTFTGVDLNATELNPAGKAHVEMPASSGDPEPQPELVKETITVDGDLSDNGWAEEGWIEASVANGKGSIQGQPTDTTGADKPDRPFKFQYRTDDENIYVAVVMDTAFTPGNSSGRSGTNFRIWFHVNNEYAQYTHFYDVWGDADGNSYTAAKYNQSKESNSGAAIENSGVKGFIKEVDGKTVVEMSVPIAEFVPEGMVKVPFYANTMDIFKNGNDADENVGMFYPAIPYGPEDAEKRFDVNLPWVAWYTDGEGIIDLEAAKLGEIVIGTTDESGTSETEGPSYEETIKENMGPANENGKFEVELTGPQNYKAG
ncbi:MAG: hypothetical protein IJQ53_03140, partial [Clostridia bacterium]|nr:hypothetical protein [Clostridia bacterium]